MVSITIYMEGGVLPNDNVASLTMDNSVKLTESFTKLFGQVFEESEFDIKVEMGSGEKQTATFYKNAVDKVEEAVLLVDVYKQKSKTDKIAYLKLEDYSDTIFFMVREMEAWILSQPNIIEEFGQIENLIRKKEGVEIKEDKSLKDKDIQKINKPSDVLKTILGRFFDKKPKKKQKYGKLKNAPTLIELLDINQLREDFEDVDNLINYINSK